MYYTIFDLGYFMIEMFLLLARLVSFTYFDLHENMAC